MQRFGRGDGIIEKPNSGFWGRSEVENSRKPLALLGLKGQREELIFSKLLLVKWTMGVCAGELEPQRPRCRREEVGEVSWSLFHPPVSHDGIPLVLLNWGQLHRGLQDLILLSAGQSRGKPGWWVQTGLRPHTIFSCKVIWIPQMLRNLKACSTKSDVFCILFCKLWVSIPLAHKSLIYCEGKSISWNSIFTVLGSLNIMSVLLGIK